MGKYERVSGSNEINELVRTYTGRFGYSQITGIKSFITRVNNVFEWVFNKMGYSLVSEQIEFGVCNLLGLDYDHQGYYLEYKGSRLKKIVNALRTNDEDFIKLLLICHIVMDVIKEYEKGDFPPQLRFDKNNIDFADEMAIQIANEIVSSGVNIAIYKNETSYEFFPETEPMFDDVYARDVLAWLEDYPKTQEQYRDALKKMIGHSSPRDSVDSFRLALELFCKDLFKNEKSLENQIEYVGKYIKNRGVSAEIGSMFIKLIDLYAKYNNKNAKHDNSARIEEVDFIGYLTGACIRFLIQLSKESVL